MCKKVFLLFCDSVLPPEHDNLSQEEFSFVFWDSCVYSFETILSQGALIVVTSQASLDTKANIKIYGFFTELISQWEYIIGQCCALH